MSRKVDSVKDINDSKETWRLAVPIMDVWSVVNNKGIEHLEMIVMNSLGDRIQVLIRHDHLLKWKDVIKENMTCIIKNDSVYNNDFQWKVCDHSKKIVFLGGTTMKAIELQNIPPKGYFFKDFGEILQGKCKTDRLEGINELETALSTYKSISADAPGQIIWSVAENYRFEPALIEGKKLIADIGKMMSVQVIVEGSMNSSNPYFSSSWRRSFTGGFILDMSVHFIAGLRMILWRVVGTNETLQIERGFQGQHGYLVSLYDANGQCKSSFFPFSGVTEELKAFFNDVSENTLKKGSQFVLEHRLSFVEGARDVALLEAMLEFGSRQGKQVQVKKF
ncbi:hypothetical protein KIW84_011445 [Lathyrus oleraceus]|uniref:Replication protein A 70 kDa DNA-binding subunit B/D first OB fold domain-containing protein n=1 Tax=Pisum sativum TaxID=3888 RepID=A0A9D5BEY0_PEA|nr:hypothetical protein KIW84_011445 [Pisum sativum]